MLTDKDKVFLGRYLTHPNPLRQYAKKLIQEEEEVEITYDFAQFLSLFMKIITKIDQFNHMAQELENMIRWLTAVYNCNTSYIKTLVLEVYNQPSVYFLIKNLSTQDQN